MPRRTNIDRRVALGLILGAAGALTVGAFRRHAARATGPLLSDADGAFDELVLQYVPRAANIVTTTYQQFLRVLDRRVRVYVVVPTTEAFDELIAAIGDVPPQLVPVVTGHEMSTWSRDRWLALSRGRSTTLLAAAAENAATHWPERQGDSLIATDLARELSRVSAKRAELLFDGGDFVADTETVFVTARMVRKNTNSSEAARTRLQTQLQDVLGKPVVLLREDPDHHAGMFLMLTGSGRALVGDPSRARPLVDEAGHDFTAQTQARFDAVAHQVAAAGYEVTRMPVAPGQDGRTYETPLNSVLENGRTVYMPSYTHTPDLNTEAAAVWESIGYTVHPIDCTSTYTHFGSLRCLVNVLRRA